MGPGTPPHALPNTPPHSVLTTPPPQQGPPQPPSHTVHRHSPGPTSTMTLVHTMPRPIVTTAALPPGLPRHPIPRHDDTHTILHQGIIVGPDVAGAIHPGIRHPSPTHMVNNPPPPLMPNLPPQQPPLRQPFPPQPPQFVAAGPPPVINYGQPPGPHYQIGGPVPIQHYPTVSVSIQIELLRSSILGFIFVLTVVICI